MNKYRVNDNHDFSFDSNDSIDVVKISESNYHVLVDNKAYQLELIKYDSNKRAYSVKIEGKIFNIEAKNEKTSEKVV